MTCNCDLEVNDRTQRRVGPVMELETSVKVIPDRGREATRAGDFGVKNVTPC